MLHDGRDALDLTMGNMKMEDRGGNMPTYGYFGRNKIALEIEVSS
jgi:hypothetical protein